MRNVLLTDERSTEPPITRHRQLFIGGLHRSGTSLLCRCLGQHPMLGMMQNTHVPEDEGQHLQDVYPTGERTGGPGKFGFTAAAHLTEHSPLAHPDNALRLWNQWLPYWDARRPLFLEKSPPNLIHSRFLQALFPEASFVMVVRHPIAVSLATQKWSWTTLESLLEHWHVCHRLMREDVPYLRRVRIIRYEDFVANPQQVASDIYAWLGVPAHEVTVKVDGASNERYFARWRKFRQSWWGTWRARRLEQKYREVWQSFGYTDPSL